MTQPIELKVYHNICLKMVINIYRLTQNHYSQVYQSNGLLIFKKNTDKLVSANLKKRTLKKLILGTCTKTSLSLSKKLYQQKVAFSIGSSLGPVLANIIMTELEDVVFKPLIPALLMVHYC